MSVCPEYLTECNNSNRFGIVISLVYINFETSLLRVDSFEFLEILPLLIQKFQALETLKIKI